MPLVPALSSDFVIGSYTFFCLELIPLDYEGGVSWVVEASNVLHRKIGKTSFNYLDLPIYGNPRRLPFWIPLVDRIKKCLFGWKFHNLSMDDCLVLLKYDLVFNPINFRFLFNFFNYYFFNQISL
ncbi:hypothetical protein MTR_7g082580 [Medicago truncatula]|uniref:Uncharacterized protein n=1 Tax=Medicago truncatula TaxID=3880 RepID=G7KV67_MEDTR|nr:hypothetical protein MTR_7g082580 [Medicago truncatula]